MGASTPSLQPHQLAALLIAGFFSPSDDAYSDSWETQRNRFEEEALHLATRLLLTDDEACRVAEGCVRGRQRNIRSRQNGPTARDASATLPGAPDALSLQAPGIFLAGALIDRFPNR